MVAEWYCVGGGNTIDMEPRLQTYKIANPEVRGATCVIVSAKRATFMLSTPRARITSLTFNSPAPL
jgi:hypothetical protein